MHNHDNVSIPKNGFNTKYTITATIQANIEKINCLNDKPKNILSVKSLISLFIFSLSSYPFQILPFLILGTLLLSICVSDFERVRNFGFQCIHALLLPVALLAAMYFVSMKYGM